MDRKSKKSLTSALHDRASNTKQFSRQLSKSSSIQKLPQFVTMEHYEILNKKIEILENEAIRHNKVLNLYIERIEELEGLVKKLEEEHQEIVEEKISSISSSLCSAKSLNRNKPNKFVDLSEQNSSHHNIAGGLWARFAQFFKQRPTMEALKKQNIYKNEPCFDTELDNVEKHEGNPTVPKIVVECVRIIESKTRLQPTEGLYRMSGNHVEIQKIRFLIDANNYDCLNDIKDIHTVVGVLKLFLREIKTPLVNASEVKLFTGSPRDWTLAPIKLKIDVLQKLIKFLPEQNRDTLSFFLKHLYRLTRTPLQFVNSRSLAVSLTPTIFHFTVTNISDIHTTLKESEALTSCLEVMIEYQEKIFETKFMSKNLYRRWPSCPCLSPNKLSKYTSM